MKTKLVSVFLSSFILLSVTGYSATLPQNNIWPKVYDVRFEQKGASVILQWKADAEPKEIYYEIETSNDAVNYKTAAIVLGGFSEGQNYSYLFKSKHEAGSKTYFRIKQINNDGSCRIVSEQSF